jgi:hypothetical protein
MFVGTLQRYVPVTLGNYCARFSMATVAGRRPNENPAN